MERLSEDDNPLLDGEQLPDENAIDLGHGVCATWGWAAEREPDGEPRLLIWHFCDHRNWSFAKRNDIRPCWRPAGVGAHTVVSKEPLHLEPSLIWPDCCGQHGFVRDGKWVPA